MPTYVLLMKGQDRGSFQLLITGAYGLRKQRKAIESIQGVRVIHQYPVTGHYDYVAIVNFPDDESCLAIGLALNTIGLYTEELRAYTPEEVARAQTKIPGLASLLKTDDDKKETAPSMKTSEAKSSGQKKSKK